MKRAILTLADGTVFEGYSFGADGETSGEVVFNTSMTGYQEIITDPSYRGQIVVMTYPHIGNYGINDTDVESRMPWLSGIVVKEICRYPSNWRLTEDLETYLARHNIIGISGIDTRALTRHIREKGAMVGIISTDVEAMPILAAKAKLSAGLVGRDLVKEVTCRSPYSWSEGTSESINGKRLKLEKKGRSKVVVYDFGLKYNILRSLFDVGCRVTVVPAHMPAEDVLMLNPDGIVLSNGPGDPEAVVYAIENVRRLIGRKPILGICMGHQILSLALGGKTYKLKFGHHGGNHPVLNTSTGKVEITSQNHGFAVEGDSIRDTTEITHLNLNDGTVEGVRHKDYPVFSIQYHPEASPGPHDSSYLFNRFAEMLRG